MQHGRARALAVAIALMATATAAQAANGKRVLGHVPADCRGVAVINFERAVSSKHWTSVRGALSRTDEFKQGLGKLEAAGFDLERDLKTVVAAFPAGIEGAATRNLILVEARLDRKSLRALLTSLPSNGVRQHRGTDVYPVDSERSLALSGGLIVFGTTEDVERSIDVTTGRARSLRKSGLAKALVRSIDRNADFWMVADAGGAAMGPMASGSPRAVAFSVDLAGGGLAVRATVDSGSTASAQQLVQTVNMGSASLANDASVQMMGLAPIIQKLKVLGDGPRVRFSLDLSEADVAGMAPLFEMLKSQI